MLLSTFVQIATALAAVVFLPTIVSAKDYAPYITFNGEKEEPGKSCSPNEWNKVTKKIDESYKEDKISTRNLRHGDIVDTSMMRHLNACGCRYCFLKGTGCARDPNRRRNLGTAMILTDEEAYNKCTAGFVLINATLNELAPKLSTSCRALVDSTRTYSCFERVPCQIENIVALDPDSGKVLDDRMLVGNNKKLCNKSRITFQAVTSFDLGAVTFDMKFPNGTMVNRNDTDAPFYMYGHNGTKLFGANFAIGDYTLDVGTTNSTKGGKSVSFRVDVC